MAQRPEPSLITEAEPSLQDQQRARVRKYTIMMSFRIPLFILASLVYAELHNGILAMAILAASIPLPWMAVLIANDRPPKRKQKTDMLSPSQGGSGDAQPVIGRDRSVVDLGRPASVVDLGRPATEL
ncbi:DUF3099 domain-containing protein [Segniliparus rugosus]|uniref:DUF3099 domain-containing protein n=1 Tax=Segniliparus rugosus (strain ATCC BAA-974 / DSM 45345 / CCUG 50838 / CIP 108380 / JCM 13579 / CDC 945) TaxID=679197 RepID=E5XMD0_SEGRC|nr:DUF3099 domain-containing protein [Segniliparus rugosus]EFV14509.1 hypothetical protein HMPREF9336_00650 [Segniliparus rugosus ATCC BAA-974]